MGQGLILGETKMFVKAVKQYALDHYNQDGWDILVECWDYDDIAHVIEGATTEAEAIARAREATYSLHCYREEIRNS